MKQQWINFVELRKQLVFADVLASYDVHLEPKTSPPGQHVGKCPLPTHTGTQGKSFSANFDRGVWQCFGCNQSGNVIDFAVLMEGKDKENGKDVRKIAAMLRERFVERSEKPKEPAKRQEESRAVLRQTVINQPLDFTLKTLEADHPFFAAQHLSAETVALFGLGFCSRGTFGGRIAIPLMDDAERLVAYGGLAIDDSEVTPTNPKYIFPAPREVGNVLHVFDPTKFFYNGCRIGKAVKNLIIVRNCHLVWPLWQAGYRNVVALMGDTCGAEQAEYVNLLTPAAGKVWLVTDLSEEARGCAASVLPRVAANRLCRWITVLKENEIGPDHPLLTPLAKR